ncbi:hypothetical protein LTR91_003178 [Friedmanniomyces endolithicus]|uniref:Uncharacterized protein n=1 Tax=Friedmanniomyces endolithicus TaxID=329885 RepID=A0AAN6KWP7_9PEZI|nr:hypothetical protein LTS00_016026 [Friedmanniomyces endolithicus]KAK0274202.1 hypothetical protein LTR35_011711 [Friedmanniomyces endolithicus]KAK0311734.1 hypothetical protein LTR82_014106 [Friedmanniomyces endolithicus]KAK0910977.1 hypothetical protein LTR57_015611 [Friedmanniomyces endolithicus]KAK0983588.1 hypothetical protein LTR54_014253 [Friedmanniomyces endolithicus]
MQLLSTSAISSALVGRVSYADPSVQRELDILFGNDATTRVKLIEANRKTMLAVAKKNWRDLFAIEATRFGKDSFAANKDTFRRTDHIQRHTTATFPELMQIERHKAKKEKIDKQQPVNEGDEVAHDSEDDSDDGESMAAYVTVNNTDVLSEEDKVSSGEPSAATAPSTYLACALVAGAPERADSKLTVNQEARKNNDLKAGLSNTSQGLVNK